ncbi:TIGR00282 family metallophosphoesterase [Marispirochaeta sp.]|jgi:2',3'-cyclic-nucleotide 2'-phosphodiesterase|uniref:TIGR00282 family metallophosphoesterase n=1 Tax=Marispirochaeta sp. TaxID=2038653 RepID=UPI0029C9487F|nr:TIGR00282 family metallophosphoesterase [Marispirochaeta sp.]
MAQHVNALILGDIVGQPGIRAVFIHLKQLIRDTGADLVIANGENSADGFGITPQIVDQLFSCGVDVITTGNHVWQKREIINSLENSDRILRPANYPPGAPGKGVTKIDVKGIPVAVINLQGRQHMYSLDCPFRSADEILKKLDGKAKIRIIDFHAEEVMEKEALAYYLNGRVSAVLGTHTHIQTADERILSDGTAYITDIGMTGPARSVIGVNLETAIERSLTQMPLKMAVADMEACIRGVHLRIDGENGRCVEINRIFIESSL